jgi:hypothetical protein
MLRAILAALRSALSTIGQGLWWCVTTPVNVVGHLLGRLGGGGHSLPPPPIAEETAAMVEDKVTDTLDKTRRVDESALVRRYARRLSRDLSPPDISTLRTELQEWLQRLDKSQLSDLASANISQVTDHLLGYTRIGKLTWHWEMPPAPPAAERENPWKRPIDPEGRFAMRVLEQKLRRAGKPVRTFSDEPTP